MTLLSLCTNVANNVGVAAPATIVGNTDPAAVRLLALARRAGRSLALRANWTALVTEYTFQANGTSDYNLPTDFRSLVDNTMWDRTRFWRMRGPMSPQQWQLYKSSIIGRATIERRWRIRVPTGAVAGAPTQFEIDPPITGDTTSDFVFEYVSKNWCASGTNYELADAVPVLPGTDYALDDTITFRANGITTIAPVAVVTGLVSGTTGLESLEIVTPGLLSSFPAVISQFSTSGSGTGATFEATGNTIPPASQPDWTADTDTAILDEDLIEMGLIWRLQERLGLAYAEAREEYEREVDKAVARDGGAGVLNLAPGDRLTLIGPYNVPETGFGGNA